MADRFGASEFIASVGAVTGAIADPTERNKDVGTAVKPALLALFLANNSEILRRHH